MDATTALVLSALLFRMLNKLPNELQQLVLDFYLRIYTPRSLYLSGTFDVACSIFIASMSAYRQPDGTTTLHHAARGLALQSPDSALDTMASYLIGPLISAINHPRTGMRNQLSETMINKLLALTRRAIINTTCVTIDPASLRLITPSLRLNPFCLRTIGFSVEFSSQSPLQSMSKKGVQRMLCQIQNGVGALVLQAPALKKVELQILGKDAEKDCRLVLKKDGRNVSFNKELVDTVKAMLVLPGRRSVVARYRARRHSPGLWDERQEMKDAIMAADVAWKHMVIDKGARMVEISF